MYTMNWLDLSRSFVQDAKAIGCQIITKLDIIFFGNNICVIWVSWGPDSVYLLCQVVSYFVRMKRNLKNIHVVHIDYWFRSISWQISADIKDKCKWLTFHWYKYEWAEKEWKARDFRRDIFRQICLHYWINTILLWNHLDDRIETCLYRMTRWYWVYGLIWFKFAWFLDSDNSRINLYRPLIDTIKIDILNHLLIAKIGFDIDSTNLDMTYTIRNRIRSIISHNSIKENYYENRQDFFSNLQQKYTFPTSITSIATPERVDWTVDDITWSVSNELLSYCKAICPHLSQIHFERIKNIENGQKIELWVSFITKYHHKTYCITPKDRLKNRFEVKNSSLYIWAKTLNQYLKDKYVPRFLRDNRPIFDWQPLSEDWRLDQLNK